MTTNIHHSFSSSLCRHCCGAAPGWKCPKCGASGDSYDPRHFEKCSQGGKMEAKCEKCQQAESKCSC